MWVSWEIVPRVALGLGLGPADVVAPAGAGPGLQGLGFPRAFTVGQRAKP